MCLMFYDQTYSRLNQSLPLGVALRFRHHLVPRPMLKIGDASPMLPCLGFSQKRHVIFFSKYTLRCISFSWGSMLHFVWFCRCRLRKEWRSQGAKAQHWVECTSISGRRRVFSSDLPNIWSHSGFEHNGWKWWVWLCTLLGSLEDIQSDTKRDARTWLLDKVFSLACLWKPFTSFYLWRGTTRLTSIFDKFISCLINCNDRLRLWYQNDNLICLGEEIWKAESIKWFHILVPSSIRLPYQLVFLCEIIHIEINCVV